MTQNQRPEKRCFHLFTVLCAFGYSPAKIWAKKGFAAIEQNVRLDFFITLFGAFSFPGNAGSFSGGFFLHKKKLHGVERNSDEILIEVRMRVTNGVAEIRTQVHALRTHEDGPGYPTTPFFLCWGCLLVLAWHKKTSFDDCLMVAHFSAKVLYRRWVIALES
jgi:hypothetical protein